MQDHAATVGTGEAFSHDVTMAPPGCWPDLQELRFRHLLRHWAERRNGLMAPRNAIDPGAIRDGLPNVWIYQYLPGEDDFLCTLAGEAVNQAWGRSLIGRRVTQIMAPEMQDRILPLYRRMLQVPAVQVSRRRIVPADSVAQSAERLIVPLAREDGGPYGVLGLTVYYLGRLRSLEDPRDIQGAVTLYDCRTLPAAPP